MWYYGMSSLPLTKVHAGSGPLLHQQDEWSSTISQQFAYNKLIIINHYQSPFITPLMNINGTINGTVNRSDMTKYTINDY